MISGIQSWQCKRKVKIAMNKARKIIMQGIQRESFIKIKTLDSTFLSN